MKKPLQSFSRLIFWSMRAVPGIFQKNILLTTLLALVLAACDAQTPTAVDPMAIIPTPTLHSLFLKDETTGPSIEKAATQIVPETGTQAGGDLLEGGAPQEQSAEESLRHVVIFDESLAQNWKVFSSDGMKIDTGSTAQAHSGRHAIEVTPTQPESKLYITLMPGGKESYQRSLVAGISLWLYSGEEDLDLYDLAITAIGSNINPYYQANDRSGENEKPYEETFLYWLGFNDTIPAHTWVEIQIWLDQMQFDPEYQYVTGLYLTNRFNFKRTFYIDDISMILVEKVTPVKMATPQNSPNQDTR